MSYEHLVEAILGGYLREAQLLALEKCAIGRVMPRANLGEPMRGKVVDPELSLQLGCSETLAQIVSKCRLTMLTKAVVPVKIVDHKTVQSLGDAMTNPGLEHRTPMGVVEAGPVLLHATNGVAVVLDWCAVGIFLQKLQWVIDRPRAEEFFLPQIAVELEKTARPLGAFGISHQKLDVEMTDHR